MSWENWAVIWYKWLLGISRRKNPCVDRSGKYCSVNQTNRNVWFLAGTFGNTTWIKRKCTIPHQKAILLPILVKQDSFAEDKDLTSEEQLVKRSRDATDKVLHMEAEIDGEKIKNIKRYRVQSEIFDLRLRKNNVYNFAAGVTKSVCDGYWLFIKPLEKGKHNIYFKGETLLDEPFTKNLMTTNEAYTQIKKQIRKNSTFMLEVQYDIMIVND
jgi:hypothetical protein